MTTLDPYGTPVTVGRMVLRTPGLRGIAEAHLPATEGLRSAERATASLDAAFASLGMETQETLEIHEAAEVDAGGAGETRTSQQEPGIEVDVPDPGPDYGQVLLYKDEAGVMTWNFALPEESPDAATRGAAMRRYVVRRHVPPAPTDGAHRGLFGAVGSKLLKALAFKLIDPVAGLIGPYFVRKWEEKQRPYLVRSFAPENYRNAGGAALDGEAWRRLEGGRALLMIHGTISRTHSAFGAMERATIEALGARYGGRMFAFDHFTLSEDPVENLRKFIAAMPNNGALDLDIVCHSRGGLVARVLAEQQSALSLGARRIRINRVVFVAVPNSGTILADMNYMSDFIDTYTNLLNFLPDNGVTETLECIVTVVKGIAAGTVRKLEGLQSMRPDGDFLRTLNRGPRDGKRYFALSSDYEPGEPGWKAWVADRLLDRVFKQKNDLVVPTAGVSGANGSDLFPIADAVQFDAAHAVAHTRFFGQPKVQRQLLDWLQ